MGYMYGPPLDVTKSMAFPPVWADEEGHSVVGLFFSRQTVFVAILVVGCWVVPLAVPQRQKFPAFCCTLDQPYLEDKENTVPNITNWLVCSIVPCTIHAVYCLWIQWRASRVNKNSAAVPETRGEVLLGTSAIVPLPQNSYAQDTVAFLRGMLLSASVAEGFAAGLLKRTVGSPRPHFFSRCGWDGSGCAEAPEVGAFQSFPSGHATLAFSTLGFTSLYLIGKCQLAVASAAEPPRLPRRSSCHAAPGEDALAEAAIHPTSYPLAQATASKNDFFLDCRDCLAILALAPVLLACWVAGTRVADHAHHTADVVAGSALGLAAAGLFHARYFHGAFEADPALAGKPRWLQR